jgi:hypothetical protein
VDRRSGTSQVIDLFDLEEERRGDVVPDHFEAMVIEEMFYVLLGAGEIVIEADNIIALAEELFAEVGSDEAGAAGY